MQVNISTEKISQLLMKDESNIIGSIDIEYPQISCDSLVTEQYINGVYLSIANNFRKQIMAKAYPKIHNGMLDDEMIIAQSKYKNTLNKNGMISGYSDDIISLTKKGEISKLRTAITFDVNKGKYISGASVFRIFSGFRKKIFSIIGDKIDPILKNDAILNWYSGNFYLTEKDIVIFYQSKELSQDNSSILEFSVPKSRLGDILSL